MPSRPLPIASQPPGPASRARVGLALVALSVAGCGGASAASVMPQAPAFEPKDQAKCSVARSQARPLIVEWPSADRGALEARTKRGIVAVRYAGCEMEVLRQCVARGRYVYAPVTRKEDHLAIRTADELYASIPVHAVQFEGKLATSGQLDVQMTIVGTYEADPPGVRRDELEGDCRDATHVIVAISAGAFEFSAGSGAEIGEGAAGFGVAAGAESTASRELLNRDGYRAACLASTSTDAAPPEGCGAFLRVEVASIGDARREAPSGGVATSAPRYLQPYIPPPAPKLEPRSAQSITGVVGVGVGSAGLAFGLVAGTVAWAQGISLDCPDGHCAPSQEGAVGAYHTSTTLSTVGFVAGGATLLGGIVLLATSPTRRYIPQTRSAWIEPFVRPNGLGAAGGF